MGAGAPLFLSLLAALSLAREANGQVIRWYEDTTLGQRWSGGVPSPGGTPPAGWQDLVGGTDFDVKRVGIEWSGADVVLRIQTNFPLAGTDEAGGPPRGWSNYYGGNSALYRPADVLLDLDRDGTWDRGIVLSNHGLIPDDPRYPDPNFPGRDDSPGYGLSADDFTFGNVYKPTSFFTADDILRYRTSMIQMYDMADPKPSTVWMRHGTKVGSATIEQFGDKTNPFGPDFVHEIVITLSGVNPAGEYNAFNLYWGTANCGNDAIFFQAEIPEPSFAPLGLLTCGFFIMRRRRSR